MFSGGEINLTIDKYDRIIASDSNGNIIHSFAKRGSNDDQLNDPDRLEIDSQNRLIVGDSFNKRLCLFDSNYSFIHSFANDLFSGGWINLTIDKFDRIIASNSDGHRLDFFESDYSLLSTFGSKGNQLSQFNSPMGIDIDENGSVFVCDSSNHRIQKIQVPF